MFCPNCGTQNPETAQTCSKCGFHLKSAAAPKFKGTMLMMNQPAGAPGAPAPPRPAAGAPPAAPGAAPPAGGPSKLKGTMVGVAPPAAGAPTPPPAPSPFGAPPAQPEAQPATFTPPPAGPGPQQPVNPLGGTMAVDQMNAFGAFGGAPGGEQPFGAPPAAGAPPPAAGAPPAQGGWGAPPQQDYGAQAQQAAGDVGNAAAGAFGAAAGAAGQAYGNMMGAAGYGQQPGGAMQPGGMGPGGYGGQMMGGGGGPGGPGGGVNTTTPLVLSIISLLFCCLGGILGIVFSLQAKKANEQGDYATAQSKAKLAMIFSFISIGLGVLGIIANILRFVIR